MDRRVIDVDAAFRHHLFQVAQAEAVGKISAHAKQNHRAIEMAALEHEMHSI
jgi:hypothetical protein